MCTICTANVFPFNHFNDDTEFHAVLSNLFTSRYSDLAARVKKYQFNPFDLNYDNLNIPNMDSDPDLQYFNDTTFIDNLSKCDYYLPEDFNKLLKDNDMKNGILSFIHSNIRSLPKHHDELQMFLTELDIEFDIIGLTETWLNEYNCDMYGIDGYTHFRIVRANRIGGGVSVFVKNKLKCITRDELTVIDDFIEVLFIEIPKENSGLKKNCIIGVTYRPPNTDMQLFVLKEKIKLYI
jgi:hypothetical protein